MTHRWSGVFITHFLCLLTKLFLKQVPGTVQPAADRTNWNVEDLGHFIILESFQVAQNDDGSEIDVKRIQGVRNLIPDHVLQCFNTQIGSDLTINVFGIVIVLDLLIIYLGGFFTALPVVVDEAIFQNSKQPCLGISSLLK